MSKDARAYISIPAFYAHRSVLITGGTGFLGKLLCEKLLRSCPDIKEIFLLIRPKKQLNVKDRLEKLLTNKIFDTLRNERPSSFDKLIPISGDTSTKDLGLSPDDRQLLIEKVSIIFHVAATVRFDESLKDAVFGNLRSTRDICILAESMKNLVALLHVSSTYTQCDKPIVEEILYTLDIDWRDTIKIAESVDDEILKIFAAKYMGTLANTYVFTKRLAEQVIDDYSKSLPCVILRPSIVISSVKDPVKGYIDNFNGPVGMLVGGGTGVLRVFHMDSNVVADFVPVDLAIKAIITTTWKRGTRSISEDNSLDIYNCSMCHIRGISLGEMIRTGYRAAYDVPLEHIIWKPNTIITSSCLLFYLLAMILHILPALFIDLIVRIVGVGAPILLKLQRKIFVSNSALTFFLTNEWTFRNTKLLQIFENLSADDERKFGYKEDLTNMDIEEYFKQGIIGAKIYLLNEDMGRLEQLQRKRKRMDWIHEITKTLFVIALGYIIYSRL